MIPAHLSGDEKNWLLLRKKDDGKPAARPATRYHPMLATLAEEVPRGAGWEFEVKWDGYRAIATVSQSETTLTSRNGNDLTTRFEHVAKEIAKAVKTPDCVLDGEVCALDDTGRSSFSGSPVYLFGRGISFGLPPGGRCTKRPRPSASVFASYQTTSCSSPSSASACSTRSS